MKRRILITLILLGLACTEASAQWYLFPSRRKANPDTVLVTPPPAVSEQPTQPEIQPEPAQVEQPAADPIREQKQEQELPAEPLETVRVCLSLPFGEASATQSSNFMDFYFGALLAARDLGNSGIRLELSAFDSSSGSTSPNASDLAESDLIIGPVSSADILSELEKCGEGQYVVSPLDQKSAALTADHNVIHAASTPDAQAEDLARWIIEDESTERGIMTVVKEKGVRLSESSIYLLGKLKEAGIQCDTISYGILEGMTIQNRFNRSSDTTVLRKYIIASDNEAFVGDAVRNIAMLQYKGHRVMTYGSSRIKSFESLEQEDLHNVNLKLTASYHINYDDPAVKKFVLTYRSVFQAEPNAYSFSGYDIMHYFVNLCARYGRNWAGMAGAYQESGLQAGFNFRDGSGINQAVRRISYNPDHTITVR